MPSNPYYIYDDALGVANTLVTLGVSPSDITAIQDYVVLRSSREDFPMEILSMWGNPLETIPSGVTEKGYKLRARWKVGPVDFFYENWGVVEKNCNCKGVVKEEIAVEVPGSSQTDGEGATPGDATPGAVSAGR